MSLQEAFTGQVPYADLKEMAVLGKVLDRREIPERPMDYFPLGCSQADDLWGLLTQCWAFDPKARPSAAEVKESVRKSLFFKCGHC